MSARRFYGCAWILPAHGSQFLLQAGVAQLKKKISGDIRGLVAAAGLRNSLHQPEVPTFWSDDLIVGKELVSRILGEMYFLDAAKRHAESEREKLNMSTT